MMKRNTAQATTSEARTCKRMGSKSYRIKISRKFRKKNSMDSNLNPSMTKNRQRVRLNKE